MRIESITVGPERVEAIVRMDPRAMRTSDDPAIAERALALLPGLASHRCVNDNGITFAEEIADTEVAHLLEHAALELMAGAGSPRSLKGVTSWDFKRDGRGVFRVSLEYDDDLVAIAAIKAAASIVGYACDGGEAPDVVAEVRDIAALRGWGTDRRLGTQQRDPQSP